RRRRAVGVERPGDPAQPRRRPPARACRDCGDPARVGASASVGGRGQIRCLLGMPLRLGSLTAAAPIRGPGPEPRVPAAAARTAAGPVTRRSVAESEAMTGQTDSPPSATLRPTAAPQALATIDHDALAHNVA